MKQKRYSVLLLRPAYMSETVGQDTYYDWVYAEDPVGAINRARHKAVAVDETDPNNLHDYHALLVIEGHHKGLDTEGE